LASINFSWGLVVYLSLEQAMARQIRPMSNTDGISLDIRKCIVKCSDNLNWANPAQRAEQIFNVAPEQFEGLALEIFRYQLANNAVYRHYVDAIGKSVHQVNSLLGIPALPIGFFRSHDLKSFEGEAALVFTSSQTGGGVPSRHLVQYPDWYKQVSRQCFSIRYGDPSQYAFCCLLPAYLERQGSSLVYMAQYFSELSDHPATGFFLHAGKPLADTLQQLISQATPTFLLGVSFALLDFSEQYRIALPDTIRVMETGGMKGRRKEMVRNELHELLQQAFNKSSIHGEYGMTELMSQAYSEAKGLFVPPPWMKVLVRSEDDPFQYAATGEGLLTIFDLANIDSCAFIETADVGRVYPDGSFEVLGRMDNSDIRGCSLLVV
jgi:hypothetical protein